jgi:hypothetical protein
MAPTKNGPTGTGGKRGRPPGGKRQQPPAGDRRIDQVRIIRIPRLDVDLTEELPGNRETPDYDSELTGNRDTGDY